MSVGSLQVYCSLMVLDLHPFQSVARLGFRASSGSVSAVFGGTLGSWREGGKGVAWREGSKSS